MSERTGERIVFAVAVSGVAPRSNRGRIRLVEAASHRVDVRIGQAPTSLSFTVAPVQVRAASHAGDIDVGLQDSPVDDRGDGHARDSTAERISLARSPAAGRIITASAAQGAVSVRWAGQ